MCKKLYGSHSVLAEAPRLTFTLVISSAGRDTTAQALSWMFYLMHRSISDASIVPKLVKEIDEVLEGAEPTYESYKRMKYSEACLYEGKEKKKIEKKNCWTCGVWSMPDFKQREPDKPFLYSVLALRLYPSVPRNLKVAVQDDVWPGTAQAAQKTSSIANNLARLTHSPYSQPRRH